ncbi:MAG: AcrB/AcrD/AcrF family protein [Gammaproteobacteria bacterium]|nr:MAG: AcrB/AcrD/AcrF family protein [Gammaproteobacteria bacterium]
MDNFLNFFVKQKKLALAFTISIISVGLLILNGIQRNQFPIVDLEIMIVTTAYPGASPEDVEKNVTNLIEDELRGVTGIDKYTSTSSEGLSVIVITLDQDLDDTKSVKQEVREAINRVRSFPVEVVDLPKVTDAQPSRGILRVGIGAKYLNYEQLRNKVDDISHYLERVEGVSEVAKDGYLDKQIQIHLNPDKLNQYKLSLNEVINSVSSRNKRYTVGTNHNKINEKNIVVLAKFGNDAPLEDVVLKSTFNGPVIHLSDVATIVDGNVEQTDIVRINGKKGFILTIFKHDYADVIDTVDLVQNELEAFNQKNNNQLQFSYSSNESSRVKNRLEIVTNNGAIGLLMVLIVLSVFLNLKTAFWVALSLPVSLLGTVLLLGVFGENINLISLAAMILVLGIVVDDSIVVAESIHHYKQKGLRGVEAAVIGLKRVIMPVITTITTTILVFSSMFLMGGTMGKFIYVIPLVVIFALLLSLSEVLIALPAHLVSTKEEIVQKSWFNKVESYFSVVIARVLKWRYLAVGVFIFVLGFSLYFAKNNMQFVLFPVIGADSIHAKMQMSKSSSLSHTEITSKQVEALINEVVGENIRSVSNDVSRTKAAFNIDLINVNQRTESAMTLLKRLKARAYKVKGVEKLTFSVKRPGPPQGEDIQIGLIGSNDIQRQSASNQLEQIMSNITGIDNLNRYDEPGKERLEVVLDFAKMARLNVDLLSVSNYLKTAFTGIDITHVRQGQTDVSFRLYLGDGENSQAFIKQLKISNKTGNLVPITQFSKVRLIQGEPNFNHFDGQRATVISASVNDEIINLSGVTKKILTQLNAGENYLDIEVKVEGGSEDTQKSMQDFIKAFIFSILGIYLLLLLLFNSYTQPLLVLSAIPFALVGVIWAFFLHGEPLSFFAVLGTLALVGVIVNDSLVLVNHLNFLKQQDPTLDIHKWIVQGTTDRLRAVVLTTLTTLAGIIPLAYGIGGVDLLLQPMALALGYGLLFGTLMTLVLLPCLYLMNYDFVNWIARFRKQNT